MDPLTEQRVVRAADRLLADRTGILIAHRLATVERADHIVVLDGGRVIDQGAACRTRSHVRVRSGGCWMPASIDDHDAPEAVAAAR